MDITHCTAGLSSPASTNKIDKKKANLVVNELYLSLSWSFNFQTTMCITSRVWCWPVLWRRPTSSSNNCLTLTRTTALSASGPIFTTLSPTSSSTTVSTKTKSSRNKNEALSLLWVSVEDEFGIFLWSLEKKNSEHPPLTMNGEHVVSTLTAYIHQTTCSSLVETEGDSPLPPYHSVF